MNEWWSGLAAIQQVFYYIAIPFTLVLLIQSIMSIIGLGGHDADADSDADFDMDTDSDFDMDADADMDADFDADAHIDMHMDAHADGHDHGLEAAGFRFFTVRGIVAFFCIFGWSGLTFYASGIETYLTVFLAIVCGLIAMLVIGLMFFAVKRLQSSGNIKYSNAIGKTAEVYIPIPANRGGKGKIMVMVQERLVEAEALSDEETMLKTGENVKVVGNISNTLIVKR